MLAMLMIEPRPCCFHRRHRSLTVAKQAGKIALSRMLPTFRAFGLQTRPRGRRGPGAVHQHVEPAKSRQNLVVQCVDRVKILQVERQAMNVVTLLPHFGRELLVPLQ